MKSVKDCKNFKACDMDFGHHFRRSFESDCGRCVYFTSRNCGMDVSDTIEPAIDLFS